MDVVSKFAARFERSREEEISIEEYLAECKNNPVAYSTAAVEIRVKRRTQHGEQGEVAIRFGSLDELNGLLTKLGLSRH